jgi:hypothetical protein
METASTADRVEPTNGPVRLDPVEDRLEGRSR